jgi:hypothetical protein
MWVGTALLSLFSFSNNRAALSFAKIEPGTDVICAILHKLSATPTPLQSTLAKVCQNKAFQPSLE